LARRLVLISAATCLVVVSLSGVALAAHYPPKAVTCSVSPAAAAAGSPIRVRGTHWRSGSTVSIRFLRAGTTVLGSALVGARGRFVRRVRVPASAEPGRATIRVAGADAAGGDRTCDTRLRVLAKSRTSAATLRTNTLGLTTGGLISLIGLVTALVVVRRRRSRSLWMEGTR
jgi:hypothetical protein